MLQEEIISRTGKRFWIMLDESEAIFFIANEHHSNLEAQNRCIEVMKPLNWQRTGTFRKLLINGKNLTGIGYEVPVDNPFDYLSEIF